MQYQGQGGLLHPWVNKTGKVQRKAQQQGKGTGHSLAFLKATALNTSAFFVLCKFPIWPVTLKYLPVSNCFCPQHFKQVPQMSHHQQSWSYPSLDALQSLAYSKPRSPPLYLSGFAKVPKPRYEFSRKLSLCLPQRQSTHHLFYQPGSGCDWGPGPQPAAQACPSKEASTSLGLAENNVSIRISAARAMITRSTILFSRLRGLFSNVNQAL